MKVLNLNIYKSNPLKEVTNITEASVNCHHSYANVKFKICRVADLSITSSPSMDMAYVYENYTYTIKVINNGPSNATGVILSNTLPPNCICKYINMTKGTYTCYNRRITCHIEEIPCDEEVIVAITIIPISLCTLTNSSFVTAKEYESTYNNNSLLTNTKVFFRWPNLQESIPYIWIILLLIYIPYNFKVQN